MKREWNTSQKCSLQVADLWSAAEPAPGRAAQWQWSLAWRALTGRRRSRPPKGPAGQWRGPWWWEPEWKRPRGWTGHTWSWTTRGRNTDERIILDETKLFWSQIGKLHRYSNQKSYNNNINEFVLMALYNERIIRGYYYSKTNCKCI